MEDNLNYDLTNFAKQTLDDTLTKRELLSTTARFYDPLGLLSPVVLPFKCTFQEICQLKIGWDEALPVKFISDWKESTEDMNRVSSIAIPRCILDGREAEEVTSIQLHGFADATRLPMVQLFTFGCQPLASVRHLCWPPKPELPLWKETRFLV